MRNYITIKGQWMYPREAIPRLITMVKSGLLDLARYHTTEFALPLAADAIAHAAATSGPFNRTALRFSRAKL
jgi:alcohol dehydrogenase